MNVDHDNYKFVRSITMIYYHGYEFVFLDVNLFSSMFIYLFEFKKFSAHKVIKLSFVKFVTVLCMIIDHL